MKVLILCHKPPYPAIDGGCVAMKNMADNLLGLGYDVNIISLATFKHPFIESAYPDGFLTKTNFKTVDIDIKLNVLDAFSNLVTSDSYNISRFFSTSMEDEIKESLSAFKPDCVFLESLFMGPYLSTVKCFDQNIKVVLRSHNLEYLIWQRHKENSNNPLKKLYLGLLVNQLREYEFDILKQIDGVLSISPLDKKHYLEKTDIAAPLEVISLGIDVQETELSDIKPKAFFHLGAMDWEPNLQGMQWFLENVWPKILAKSPEATLTLAGKDIANYELPVAAEGKNIRIVERVADAKSFMKENGIMLVPIIIAGGIRIKIIEGMSYGVPVVSTIIGAEGINAKDSEEIMTADCAETMANKALTLINNVSTLENIRQNGFQFAKQHFDNEGIRKKLKHFLENII
jgi:glycosyltransferase involved in cell wall biosynthesis